MREIKMKVWELEGLAITVDVKGDVEEYAQGLLHIINNVRVNSELLKVVNHYNNDVTVYCEPETKDDLIKYLKNFGEIKSCEKVLMYQMQEPDYDYDKYDDVVAIPSFE